MLLRSIFGVLDIAVDKSTELLIDNQSNTFAFGLAYRLVVNFFPSEALQSNTKDSTTIQSIH